jgi:hypothetical protein
MEVTRYEAASDLVKAADESSEHLLQLKTAQKEAVERAELG